MTMSDTNRHPHYWIIVGSIDNFRKSAEMGFTLQGLKSRHRKKAERMAPIIANAMKRKPAPKVPKHDGPTIVQAGMLP